MSPATADRTNEFIHSESSSVADDDELTLRFDDQNPLRENFDEKVQQAQERLLHLRQAQQQVERQKQELEELSEKQERFSHGRTDLLDRLNRALAVLDRETYDAQQRSGNLALAKEAFQRHLSLLDSLQPEQWSRAELQAELSHAIGAIEDAEDEYTKTMSRLGNPAGTQSGDTGAAQSTPFSAIAATGGDHGFAFWFRCGFAFTLPIMVFLFVITIVNAIFGQ